MYHVQISLKSFEPSLLVQAQKILFSLRKKLFPLFDEYGPTISSVNSPSKVKKFTVLRSPHIDKKSREQFQIKTTKQIFIFKKFQSFSQSLLLLECLKQLSFPGIQINLKISYKTCLK